MRLYILGEAARLVQKIAYSVQRIAGTRLTSPCWVKSKEIVKNFYFFRILVESTCAFGRKKLTTKARRTRRKVITTCKIRS